MCHFLQLLTEYGDLFGEAVHLYDETHTQTTEGQSMQASQVIGGG